MSNEYYDIHHFARDDPYLKGLENLFALVDVEFFQGGHLLQEPEKKPEKRVAIDVCMFNYTLIGYYPKGPVTRITFGAELKKALKEGVLEINNLLVNFNDYGNHTCVSLPKDIETRRKYGLEGLSLVEGIMIFHQPARNIKAFDRQTGEINPLPFTRRTQQSL